MKATYAGYYVEGLDLHDAKPVDVEETDDAEIQAILFAIEKLKGKYEQINLR